MIEGMARIYHPLHGARILVLLAVASPACQAGAGSTEGTLTALSTESAELGTQVAAQATLITHLATRGPPRITQPVGTLQPTPYEPFQGFVEIEAGGCCVGGKAGDPLDICVVSEGPIER